MSFCEVLNGYITPLILGGFVLTLLVLVIVVNFADHVRPVIDPVTREEKYRRSYIIVEIMVYVIILIIISVGLFSLMGWLGHCY